MGSEISRFEKKVALEVRDLSAGFMDDVGQKAIRKGRRRKTGEDGHDRVVLWKVRRFLEVKRRQDLEMALRRRKFKQSIQQHSSGHS